MDADDVEAVVVTELRLELDGEVAADRSDEAEDDRRKSTDEPSCRGDGDETGDDTRSPAERCGVAITLPFDSKPGDHAYCARHERVEYGLGGDTVGRKGRTAIEAEPNQTKG